MKVENLLAMANNCKNILDAQMLRIELENAFSAKPNHLAHIISLKHPVSPDTTEMEDGTPFIYFGYEKPIGQHFCLAILLELRQGRLRLFLRTYHSPATRDSKGRIFDIIDNSERTIDCEPEDTLASITLRAKNRAIELQADLMESTGVPRAQALKIAADLWK